MLETIREQVEILKFQAAKRLSNGKLPTQKIKLKTELPKKSSISSPLSGSQLLFLEAVNGMIHSSLRFIHSTKIEPTMSTNDTRNGQPNEQCLILNEQIENLQYKYRLITRKNARLKTALHVLNYKLRQIKRLSSFVSQISLNSVTRLINSDTSDGIDSTTIERESSNEERYIKKTFSTNNTNENFVLEETTEFEEYTSAEYELFDCEREYLKSNIVRILQEIKSIESTISEEFFIDLLDQLYNNYLTIIDQETSLYFYRRQLYYNINKELYILYQKQQHENQTDSQSDFHHV